MIVHVVLLGLKEVQGLVIVMGTVEVLVVLLVSLVVKKEELLQTSSHRSGVLMEDLDLDETVNSCVHACMQKIGVSLNQAITM